MGAAVWEQEQEKEPVRLQQKTLQLNFATELLLMSFLRVTGEVWLEGTDGEELGHILMPSATPALENHRLLLGYIQPDPVPSDPESPGGFLELLGIAELSFHETGEARMLKEQEQCSETFWEGTTSALLEAGWE